MDEDEKTNAPMDSEPQASSTSPARSSSPVEAEDAVSGSLFLQRELPLSQQGVVVVSQDPTSRLTLWLPGQADAEYGKDMTTLTDGFSVQLSPNGNYLEVKPPTASSILQSPSEAADPTMSGSEVDKLWDMNIHTVDVWPIPTQTENTEDFQKQNGFGRSTSPDEATGDFPNEIGVSLLLLEHPKPLQKNQVDVVEEPPKKHLPDQTGGKGTNKSDFSEEEPSGINMDEILTEEVNPIIRSKLEFSKGPDGSQKLSYEEELNQTEGKLVQRRAAGEERTRKVPRLKGLRSTFMYLMRLVGKQFTL